MSMGILLGPKTIKHDTKLVSTCQAECLTLSGAGAVKNTPSLILLRFPEKN